MTPRLFRKSRERPNMAQEHAKPIIDGTSGPQLKVYHELKGDGSVGDATP